MKISRTTIKDGIAYGWTMPDRPTTYLEDSPLWNAVEDIKYKESVDRARAEAIEWEDQKYITAFLILARVFKSPIYDWKLTKEHDGDYSHEPIEVEIDEKSELLSDKDYNSPENQNRDNPIIGYRTKHLRIK